MIEVGKNTGLGCPWRLVSGEKATEGGFSPPAIKKLNGAKFGMPSAEIVETKAIGRGATR